MLLLDVREGASGDMILGSFIDAGLLPMQELRNILEVSAKVMDPTAKLVIGKETHAGEGGTTLVVHHWGFDEVRATSMRKHLTTAIRELGLLKSRLTAGAILEEILRAESIVHRKPVEELHLHETGSPDTLVDIIGTSHFFDSLGQEISCTPISVGSGKVKIAHGVFDVPPPAVRELLNGMDWTPGPYEGEMATPTGVAVLRVIAKGKIKSPGPYARRLGTGFGSRTFAGRRTAVRLYSIEDRNSDIKI